MLLFWEQGCGKQCEELCGAFSQCEFTPRSSCANSKHAQPERAHVLRLTALPKLQAAEGLPIDAFFSFKSVFW